MSKCDKVDEATSEHVVALIVGALQFASFTAQESGQIER